MVPKDRPEATQTNACRMYYCGRPHLRPLRTRLEKQIADAQLFEANSDCSLAHTMLGCHQTNRNKW